MTNKFEYISLDKKRQGKHHKHCRSLSPLLPYCSNLQRSCILFYCGGSHVLQ